MRGYQNVDFVDIELSVAMTESLDEVFASHLDKGPNQEDLTFAYWRASRGLHRYTAVIHEAALPGDGDRILQGNVAFTSRYFERVLDQVSAGSGIALLHSHLGPGWQDMSEDDEVAERDRLAGPAAARTGLPILGLTRGTDGAWSARLWLREMKHKYVRRWASTVRVVEHRLRVTHHPDLSPVPLERPSQQATISVWGEDAQSDLVRIHA